jgi:transposase, IS4 family
MGCQKEIVKSILKGKGNYLLAVKGNQERLYKAVKEALS